ncbi:MAG: VOC family protein [Candidatus Acidiferrales bacterium]|jgi:catechol 2,3-dioxygenase-like lactoylglutathione lyase family enzyme
MKKLKAVNSLLSSNLGVIVAAGALTVAMATAGLARSSAGTPDAAADGGSGKVLGMAFDGHQVSNLDQSIKYYEVLDFHLSSKTDWKVDKVANQLGGTKGAESRTAIMTTQSSVSDKPFNLILREYRGIDRKNWSNLSSSDLGAGHMDLTVKDDCNPIMDKFKAMNMLRVPQMNLPGGGAPTNGPRRFVFLQDPDGWFIELFAMPTPAPGAPPAAPKVSNSTATQANIDRFGKQTGFNHIGLNIIDPAKALSFYQGVLGGDYPAWSPSPAGGAAPRMTMLNGWFPQATTEGHVRLELLGSPQNQGKEPPDQHFADINVNYVGFQVTDIDAVYAQAKAAGAKIVSDGGIAKMKDGRAVMLRDPDVGGFVELWEPAK